MTKLNNSNDYNIFRGVKMNKILFYQLNENYQTVLKNDGEIIQNILNNQQLKSCREQIYYLFKKQDLQSLLAECILQCEGLQTLTVAENVIHLTIGDEIFEQMIFYDHYISYEFDNSHQFLYKKLQKILNRFHQISDEKETANIL